MPTGNQLALEKSPYLQQHASNPVDWLPWGEDAFELARKTDRPVFLSIGYSTCHWCHVMERESFEDEETARALNEAFVCIKVDREERPDIDGVYMTACQMMTGSGGWPLTVLVTPDKEPFFAATYLPPKSLTGRIGVRELAAQVKELWKNRRGEILEAAANMAGQIRSLESPSPGQGDTVLSLDTLERGYHELLSRFDEKNAGFGSAPKFPTPHILLFLLRRYRETNDHKALEMATRTLRAMRLGGIWDHVGFGIHRYSTDAVWLLPHFEKMLYDQALTALACLECFQTTGDDWYASMALEIFDYVLRDMTTAEGGFASAEDADSEGEEGRFYVWTAEEIRAILGKEDGDLFMSLFSCHEEGNFLEEATGHPTGTNIPHLETPLAVHAQSLSISPEALTAKAEKMRARLFKARDLRTRPLRDDKILADWNGLMITAFARGARVLGEKRLEYAAADAADFILREMRQEDGRLLHRWRDNEAAHPGTLQDHACMLLGLLELHQAEPVTGRIGQAEELARVLLNHFRGEGGGFLLMPQDADSPLVRQTDILDGATPSGNALTMLSLIIFSRLARDPELAVAAREAALGVPDRAASMLRSQPGGLPGLLLAIEQTLAATRVLTVEGPAGNDAVMDMIQELGRRASSCDLVDFKESPENPVIRVCLRGACLPAVNSVGEALSTGL